MSPVFQWNGPGDPWAVPLDQVCGVRLVRSQQSPQMSAVRVSTQGGTYETATVESLSALTVYERLLAQLVDWYGALDPRAQAKADDEDTERWEGAGLQPGRSAPVHPPETEAAPIPEATARMADDADQLAERVRQMVTAEPLTDEQVDERVARILGRATHGPIEEAATFDPLATLRVDARESMRALLAALIAEDHQPIAGPNVVDPVCRSCGEAWPCARKWWIDQLLAEVTS